MGGPPQAALENFYNNSPYSFSDMTQRAIKALIKTPIMMMSEPDIQWWLSQRGYDYSYINITDEAAMINKLKKSGNDKAVLIQKKQISRNHHCSYLANIACMSANTFSNTSIAGVISILSSWEATQFKPYRSIKREALSCQHLPNQCRI